MRRRCCRTRKRSGTVRLRCPREVRARMWPFRVQRSVRPPPAMMVFLPRECVQVLVVLVAPPLFVCSAHHHCKVCCMTSIDSNHLCRQLEWHSLTRPFCFFILASCDASVLLPHAETVGGCHAALPSGGSCTNVAVSGSASGCTSTTCLDGVLSQGVCPGIASASCFMS